MVTNTNKDDGKILSIALFIGVAGAFTFLQRREKQIIPDPQDDSPRVLPSLPPRLSFNSKRSNRRSSMGLGNGTNVHHHFPYHDPENVNHENGHSYVIEHEDPSMTEVSAYFLTVLYQINKLS